MDKLELLLLAIKEKKTLFINRYDSVYDGQQIYATVIRIPKDDGSHDYTDVGFEDESFLAILQP